MTLGFSGFFSTPLWLSSSKTVNLPIRLMNPESELLKPEVNLPLQDLRREKAHPLEQERALLRISQWANSH